MMAKKKVKKDLVQNFENGREQSIWYGYDKTISVRLH